MSAVTIVCAAPSHAERVVTVLERREAGWGVRPHVRARRASHGLVTGGYAAADGSAGADLDGAERFTFACSRCGDRVVARGERLQTVLEKAAGGGVERVSLDLLRVALAASA